MLTPSYAGDNNESNDIKESFWPETGVTIVVHGSDNIYRHFP